ncbi:MAG: PCRF domain-containing protein [Clostridia bacterium]|nr:PCRF domain-containing protein [Clostridia bacterium]
MQSFNKFIEMFSNNYGKTLTNLLEQYNKLCNLLTYEEVLLDKKLFLSYEKEKNKLEPLILEYNNVNAKITEIIELKKLLNEISDEEKEVYVAEINSGFENIKIGVQEVIKQLNLIDAKPENVVVEVFSNSQPTTNVLYNDILKGYELFCAKNNLTFSFKNNDNNSVKISVSGLNAYKLFECEVGVHSAVLKGGQQCSCQVFVYSVLSANQSANFTENDVEFKATRSSSAGGQHVNTTDSSIRATHVPTGISVVCEDERSQFQNKAKALENLKQKVLEFFDNKLKTEIEKQKKEQHKKMKNNFVVKTYFKEDNKIIKLDKSEILYSEFLNGNIL